MPELPSLPERVRRLHDLQWKALLEKHGFNGDYFHWNESLERRRQAAGPFYRPKPEPLAPLRSGLGPDGESWRNRANSSYEEAVKTQEEVWGARQSEPAVIDLIGVPETVALAEDRYLETEKYYRTVWAETTNGDSDTYTAWLQQLTKSVAHEVGGVWRPSERHSSWFDRACQARVHDALGEMARKASQRARSLELKHLENPHLSLAAIVAADGNLDSAIMFADNERMLLLAREAAARLGDEWKGLEPSLERAKSQERAEVPPKTPDSQTVAVQDPTARERQPPQNGAPEIQTPGSQPLIAVPPITVAVASSELAAEGCIDRTDDSIAPELRRGELARAADDSMPAPACLAAPTGDDRAEEALASLVKEETGRAGADEPKRLEPPESQRIAESHGLPSMPVATGALTDAVLKPAAEASKGVVEGGVHKEARIIEVPEPEPAITASMLVAGPSVAVTTDDAPQPKDSVQATANGATGKPNTPGMGAGRRGPAADDTGHRRVAELLTDNWSEDLEGSLRILDEPKDGGPKVLPSRAWQREYEITSYLEAFEAIGNAEIKKHIKRRFDLGRVQLNRR